MADKHYHYWEDLWKNEDEELWYRMFRQGSAVTIPSTSVVQVETEQRIATCNTQTDDRYWQTTLSIQVV